MFAVLRTPRIEFTAPREMDLELMLNSSNDEGEISSKPTGSGPRKEPYQEERLVPLNLWDICGALHRSLE